MPENGDLATETIYVLRGKSEHLIAAKNREALYKISVTGNDVKRWIAGAKIRSDVPRGRCGNRCDLRAFQYARAKLEKVIRQVFGPPQVDIEIRDSFGRPVVPREWFLVPLFVIEEIDERIKDGTVTDYAYSPKAAGLLGAEEE